MIFDELMQRGLIKQSTNHNKIQNLLNNDSINFYIGFDPTAHSLHIGHLLQIITAKRLKNAGHTPIILIGGATASIGDPTGKNTMRQTLELDQTMINSENIIYQITNILEKSTIIVNNIEWFQNMNFLKFISEIGKYYSVNNMLRADCFKSRMENGLSFLEFNYMLMQGFDFLELNQRHNCILQLGGDDQWSNILAGIDLIHKKISKESFGLTIKLLTNSSGQKMGKTEKGAIWLDRNLTTIFDFFQFWRNLPDEEIKKCFKLLTFYSLEEIENIPFISIAEINNAKKKLAFELTKMIHGETDAILALKQAESLFEMKNELIMDSIVISNNSSIIDLLMSCKFAKSRTEARNLINGRGISINNEIITDSNACITLCQFGKKIILRKGKKNFCQITIEEKLINV